MQINTETPPRWKEIYALIDPLEPNTVKYIGCADDPQSRFKGHLSNCDKAPVNEWVRWLKAQGRQPMLVNLGSVRHEIASAIEKHLISLFEVTALNVVGTIRRGVRTHKSTGEPMTLEETRLATIRHVLRQCGGNKLEAARRLGIGRQTIYNAIARMSEREQNRIPLESPQPLE